VKVSRSFTEDTRTARVAFEFTLDEVIKAGLETRFVDTWRNAKWAREFVQFLAQLTGVRGPKRRLFDAEDPLGPDFQDLFEDLMRKANKTASGPAYTPGDWGSVPPGRPPVVEPAWCKILGLSLNSTKDEIKTKYRELVKQHHPDRGGDARKFHQIQQAYEEAIR
jgi:hypothetical protein